jgi:deoxyguanosine kinase
MYAAIEGVIGVGKTTLARLLQPVFHADIILEVFEENPFLSDFYSDRARYAFQTQIFFLLSRYHQQRRTIQEMVSTGKNLIADYTFAKDALFACITGCTKRWPRKFKSLICLCICRPAPIPSCSASPCETGRTNARWNGPTFTN